MISILVGQKKRQRGISILEKKGKEGRERKTLHI
jgi:hypothetical protein